MIIQYPRRKTGTTQLEKDRVCNFHFFILVRLLLRDRLLPEFLIVFYISAKHDSSKIMKISYSLRNRNGFSLNERMSILREQEQTFEFPNFFKYITFLFSSFPRRCLRAFIVYFIVLNLISVVFLVINVVDDAYIWTVLSVVDHIFFVQYVQKS